MKISIVIKVVLWLTNLIININESIAQKPNNVNDKDLITELLKIIKDDDTLIHQCNEEEIKKFFDNLRYKNKQETSGVRPDFKGFKTLLVKRLIPHNYQTRPYEYDEKLKTIYRPLVRIHTNGHNRPVFLKNSALLKENELKNDGGKLKDDFNIIYRNDYTAQDGYLLQPFKVSNTETVTANNILEDVKTYVRKEDDFRKIRELKYAILKVLENKPKLELRSMVYVPPGEKYSRPKFIEIENLETPDPPKKWGPHYSYWNYWTYNKPVHEDNCKGELVQWGKLCIETPPH